MKKVLIVSTVVAVRLCGYLWHYNKAAKARSVIASAERNIMQADLESRIM